jgi:uncharacterized protein YjbI with pentapeptide repeats
MKPPLRSPDEIIIQGKTLREILDKHTIWLNTDGKKGERANLSGANLSGANLSRADLTEAKLSGADLSGTILIKAKLIGADLYEAYFIGADLYKANLSGADLNLANLYKAFLAKANLSKANLVYANLTGANLSEANLYGVNLYGAICVETNFTNATLDSAIIFGISVWDIQKEGLKQKNLIITRPYEPVITVDSLEVAQFIYLILNNKKIRDVLDTITSKVVLILGRFTIERKVVLDALADKLRKHNLLPVIFDFERCTNLDFTETIKILAGISLFVIVDITMPKSAPQELTATIRNHLFRFWRKGKNNTRCSRISRSTTG